MKKNLIRLLAAAMGAVCVLSFAACGGNNGSKTGEASSQVVESQTAGGESSSSSAGEASSQAADSQAAGGSTVEDFLNSDQMQSTLNAMKSSMKDSGVNIDVTANGNQLVYTFTYDQLSGLDESTKAAMAAALEEALDTQAATFETIASSLKSSVGVDDASVVVRYVTSDGDELCAQEFTSKE